MKPGDRKTDLTCPLQLSSVTLFARLQHTLTMKLPSSSGVTMTTESCSFSSKWTCDGAPALGGSSEKRTPPAFAQPKWKGRATEGRTCTQTLTGFPLKGGKRHFKLRHWAPLWSVQQSTLRWQSLKPALNAQGAVKAWENTHTPLLGRGFPQQGFAQELSEVEVGW